MKIPDNSLYLRGRIVAQCHSNALYVVTETAICRLFLYVKQVRLFSDSAHSRRRLSLFLDFYPYFMKAANTMV